MREKLIYYDLDEEEREKRFHEKIKEQVHKDLHAREINNPTPTGQEAKMGLFIEAVEPQGRNAFLEMYKKGYTVHSITFDGEKNVIEGRFELDDKTKEKISKSEVDLSLVEKKPGLIEISYSSDKFDIEGIKKQWQEVVSIFPDSDKPAAPASYNGAIAFREKYMSDDEDVRVEALKARIERTKHEKRKEILQALLQERVEDRKNSLEKFFDEKDLDHEDKFLVELVLQAYEK